MAKPFNELRCKMSSERRRRNKAEAKRMLLSPLPKCRWKGKHRCLATATAIDGPVPYEERCVRKRGHQGLHMCVHGFHFKDGTP